MTVNDFIRIKAPDLYSDPDKNTWINSAQNKINTIKESTVVSEVEETVVSDQVAEETEIKAKGGLAEAIAKARQVKQEPLKSPRQQAKEQQGVKKI